MPLFAKRISEALSPNAKARLTALRPYPTLDTWRNPLTRGLARRLANDSWLKTRDDIDFDYRLTELSIADVPCVRYETGATRAGGDLILYVHGGGFLAGSPQANASTVLPSCHLSGVEAIGVDYALLPEVRFPVAYDQIDAVYRTLLEQAPERRIILLADSIGGCLSLANMLRWRDENIAQPAGAVLISPVLDGMGHSDTHITMDGHDPLIGSNAGRNVRKLFQFYAPGEALDDPRVSPLHGDMSNLPPMLIHVGTREVCLGDSARLAEKMRKAGSSATLRAFDGMFHLFHMHWAMEEAKSAHEDIAHFIGACLETHMRAGAPTQSAARPETGERLEARPAQKTCYTA